MGLTSGLIQIWTFVFFCPPLVLSQRAKEKILSYLIHTHFIAVLHITSVLRIVTRMRIWGGNKKTGKMFAGEVISSIN